MENINSYVKCDACGKLFSPKIGESLCPECSNDNEEMQDKMELLSIISRRGYQWVKDKIEEEEINNVFGLKEKFEKKEKCYFCGKELPMMELYPKKIYEGTDLIPSANDVIEVLVCEKCF